MQVINHDKSLTRLVLVGGDWNMTGLFSHILGMSSSQLTFIFFRGVCLTTNQHCSNNILPARFMASTSSAEDCSLLWCVCCAQARRLRGGLGPSPLWRRWADCAAAPESLGTGRCHEIPAVFIMISSYMFLCLVFVTKFMNMFWIDVYIIYSDKISRTMYCIPNMDEICLA